MCRAAYHTDAIIIDSATTTGIEKFCIRKGVKLVGVAPEAEILYPKVNPTERFDNELTNGHTHFVLIGDKTREYRWGDEALVKAEIADKIAAGKYGNRPKCKIVVVLLGDNERCLQELETVLSSANLVGQSKKLARRRHRRQSVLQRHHEVQGKPRRKPAQKS